MATPALPTYEMAKNQTNAIREGRGRTHGENWGQATINSSDEIIKQPYYVYIYNVLDREYFIEQPPLFPKLHIPRCGKGQKVAWNRIGAFLLEAFNKPGTFETYYKKIDGRKVATSL